MAVVYKAAGTRVAKLPGLQPVLQAEALAILATAKALAASHTDTGAYSASLTVKSVPGRKGVRDRLVVANDKAAIHIEYGHLRVQENGKPVWVPGQYILTRALTGK